MEGNTHATRANRSEEQSKTVSFPPNLFVPMPNPMLILVTNSGSASLKLDLMQVESSGTAPRRLARGRVERFGPEAATDFQLGDGECFRSTSNVPDVQAGVRWFLGNLADAFGLTSTPIGAAVHRVVHGGATFTAPTVLDATVLAQLETLSELAPLHNPPALTAIRAVQSALGADVPMVAVFDTAFHRALPPCAANYPLPHELAARHGLRRFGFHGIAHEYMLRRYAHLAGVPIEKAVIITLQLGGGCSAAAIRDGHSVDTSMGFTPLEGLMMSTRAGDLDPGLLLYLARKEGMGVADLEDMLNQRSGLLGVSGRSADMREVLAAASHDTRAALAVDMFCYRARKCIGAYLAALGGAQAVVFGGGIGENDPLIRQHICEGLDWFGLLLDPARNESATGVEGRISRDDARVQAWVVPVDEAALMAEAAAECLSRSASAKFSPTAGTASSPHGTRRGKSFAQPIIQP